MKIYHENKHVKTVPKKFEVVENIIDYFEDFERKRLTLKERSVLEKKYLEIKNEKIKDTFISELDKLVKELVENKKIVKGFKVIRKFDENHYSVKFENGIEVACSELVYNTCKIKKTIKRL